MRNRILPALLVIVLGSSTPLSAAGQTTQAAKNPTSGATAVPGAPTETDAETSATKDAPASAVVIATADENGFQFKTADNSFALRLRGEAQTDGRFLVDDASDVAANTFYLRRVRTAFQGTLYSAFDFLLRAEFGQGRTELIDAYLDVRVAPALNIQGGKFKTPVSLERLQSAPDRMFIELSYPTALLPNRDIGLQIHGDLIGEQLEYQLGVFNGVVDGASGDADAFDSKDVAARLFTHPFRNTSITFLRGLGFGIAATTGTQYGAVAAANLPSFRTPARQTFFRFRAGDDDATTVVADGPRTRITPQGYFYAGPFGLTTEYAYNTERIRIGENTVDLGSEAGHVTVSYLLTGEKATFRRLKPNRPFNRDSGHWGAFEVAGRVQTLRIEDAAFPLYADPTRVAQSALGWGIGLNWYLNANVRFAVNYERTTFDAVPGGVELEPENLILSRMQLSF